VVSDLFLMNAIYFKAGLIHILACTVLEYTADSADKVQPPNYIHKAMTHTTRTHTMSIIEQLSSPNNHGNASM